MCFNLVCLKVHFGFEDYKFLLQAFLVWAEKVIFAEVKLQIIIVLKVGWFVTLTAAIADVASFMLFSAVCIKLIVAVESFSTEATFGMTFEAALIYSTRVVIAEFLMLSKLRIREKVVFVSEDFLVSSAEITHDFLMYALDVSIEVWPAETCNITAFVRTVIPQK